MGSAALRLLENMTLADLIQLMARSNKEQVLTPITLRRAAGAPAREVT
jgi:hypothetical protein